MKRIASLLMVCAVIATPVYAKKKGALQELESAMLTALQPGSVIVPASGEIEVAFSPNEGSEQLVIKTIDSAKVSIRMLTYSFTSAPVVAALVRAKKRDVDVAVVVDFKNNISEDRSGKAAAALGTVSAAGIAVRTIKAYPIHHDKTIVIDNAHVESGSFNFSDAAARRNSENVIVMWNNPRLASVYLKHWQRNWMQGADFQPRY